MSPLTKEDLRSGLVHASAMDLSTGKIEELSTRPRSICHFFEPFVCGSYRICLRLDWKDLDGQGNPILDADFYYLGTDKIVKSMKAHEAHHTMAQGDEDRTYEWEFADESRKLRVTLAWSMSFSIAVKANVSLSMKVFRAGKRTLSGKHGK
ncbi:MAG: hypothetical protein NTU59_01465 [Coprothermobacterota bacterium]|nr:hypothetical protein [Coprothermobacterota bacterium]